MPIDPLTIAAVGAKIIGSLFGGDDEQPGYVQEDHRTQLDETRRHERLMALNKQRWLVKGAQNAGFNPLTALKGGAGATSGSPAYAGATNQPLSFGQKLLSSAGEAIAEGIQSYDPIYEESRQLDLEIKRKQLETYDNQASRLGTSVPQVRETSSPVEVSVNAAPPENPEPWGPVPKTPPKGLEGRLPVFNTTMGRWDWLTPSTAQQYKLKAGDPLLPDAFTASQGEGAEVLNAMSMFFGDSSKRVLGNHWMTTGNREPTPPFTWDMGPHPQGRSPKEWVTDWWDETGEAVKAVPGQPLNNNNYVDHYRLGTLGG